MKNIDIYLDYINLFTEDKTFNLDLLKFERHFTFHEKDFEKSKRKIIIEKMEKFLLDLTKNRGDMDMCSLKFEETVKKIQLNDIEIHRALQNSNINWQSYPALRNPFLPPVTTSSSSVPATAMVAAPVVTVNTPLAGNKYIANYGSFDNDNNNLLVIQGPKGTLSTIVNEKESLKELYPHRSY